MQGKVMTETAVVPIYCGIDVCKETLDVYLSPLGEQISIPNRPAGWRRLGQWLKKRNVALVVMEPTSKYHRGIHRHLADAGIPVALVNPLRARRFAQACGELAKTDRIDARILALIGERLRPDHSLPPSEEEEALEELINARSVAVDERTAIANRLQTTTTPFLRRELSMRLSSIEKHIKRIEAQIDAKIASNPVIRHQAEIIRSIPGMGPVNVMTLVTSLREIGQMNAKEVAAMAGLAPYACDSGPTRGQRRIQGGRPSLRKALYMAAVSAARCNPDLSRFYQRLRGNGKPPKLALVAVARKLIILANTLVAENRTWQPARP